MAEIAAKLIVAGAGSVGRLIPRGALPFFFERFARPGFYLCRSFRRRSAENLRIALGDQLESPEIDRIVRDSLGNFLRALGEVLHLLSALPSELRHEIRVEGMEHLDEARARGRGVIVLSAHLGNFFLVGGRLAVEGYPTSILLRPENRILKRILDRYHLKIGQKIIYSRPRQQALRELIRVLRHNELAMVIADEYRSGDGIPVPFFGRTVLARRGPISLALRTGAAIVPAYVIHHRSSHLSLIVEPEIELVRSGRVQADIEENTRRMTRWLETVVRAHPDQWNWMNIRWTQDSLSY